VPPRPRRRYKYCETPPEEIPIRSATSRTVNPAIDRASCNNAAKARSSPLSTTPTARSMYTVYHTHFLHPYPLNFVGGKSHGWVGRRTPLPPAPRPPDGRAWPPETGRESVDPWGLDWHDPAASAETAKTLVKGYISHQVDTRLRKEKVIPKEKKYLLKSFYLYIPKSPGCMRSMVGAVCRVWSLR
jgi:hypothetical protein